MKIGYVPQNINVEKTRLQVYMTYLPHILLTKPVFLYKDKNI